MRFENISIKQAARMLEQEGVILLDVRNKEEYEKGHLKGAVSVPYEELEHIDFQKDIKYIVYCNHGVQSMRAARDLAIRGFMVFNMIGGWKGFDKYIDT